MTSSAVSASLTALVLPAVRAAARISASAARAASRDFSKAASPRPRRHGMLKRPHGRLLLVKPANLRRVEVPRRQLPRRPAWHRPSTTPVKVVLFVHPHRSDACSRLRYTGKDAGKTSASRDRAVYEKFGRFLDVAHSSIPFANSPSCVTTLPIAGRYFSMSARNSLSETSPLTS